MTPGFFTTACALATIGVGVASAAAACGGNVTYVGRTVVDASMPTPVYHDAGTTPDPRPRFDASTPFDAGSCAFQLASPEVVPSPHVEIGSPLTFTSNPPASGPHYPIWAAFQEFATPVPRGYYVHSLEHGAVVLLYKCDSAAACPDKAAQLRALMAEFPDDSRCDPTVKKRIVLTPDPLIPTTYAAAAWGFTYTADCFDSDSLRAFMAQNYAHSPEDICAQGQTAF